MAENEKIHQRMQFDRITIIWLGRRFWNQTIEEALAPKKDQSLEQEVLKIRQLLDEEYQREEQQC